MNEVNVTFLGSGDAFGSGGKFQTCIFVEGGETRFLIDCGASSLIAMKRFKVDPATIDFILLTHLHGDHFGGVPFLVRETQIVSRREKQLVVAGPKGTEKRILAAMEVLFPYSTLPAADLPLRFIEFSHETPIEVRPLMITAYSAVHTAGTEPHSLRIGFNSKVISYSGDTEWNENLVLAARDADLFICESFSYAKEVKNHLSYSMLKKHMHKLSCKRLIMTHMGEDMLNRLHEADLESAEDGKRITL